MSKNEYLSTQEISQFNIKGPFPSILESFAREHGLEPDEINILDWGCGRGRFVLKLRQMGYNAYGVDIDPVTIEHGRKAFEELGYTGSTFDGIQFPLVALEPGQATLFPPEAFHCLFSGQVLEHVSDLNSTAAEMARLTRPGGIGYHNYPAYRHIREAHLYMPFVHWLPKNRLRRYMIAFYLTMRLSPKWPELNGQSLDKQITTYYQYSISKTFYRPASQVKQIFENAGFDARLSPALPRHLSKLKPFMKSRLFGSVLNSLLTDFVLAELYLTKR